MGYSPSRLAHWGLVIHEPWVDAVDPVMRVSLMTPIILVLTAVGQGGRLFRLSSSPGNGP